MAGGKVSRPREAVLLCVFAETTPTTTPDVSRKRGRLSAAGAACSVSRREEPSRLKHPPQEPARSEFLGGKHGDGDGGPQLGHDCQHLQGG